MIRRRRNRYSLENFILQIGVLISGYVGFLVIGRTVGISTSGAFVPSWFLAVIVLLIEVIIVAVGFKLYEYVKLGRAGMADIDKMSGEHFEEFLVILFQKLGYSVDHYSKSHRGNEYGADLIITKDLQKTVVQAKRYKLNEHVDNTAVEKLIAAKALFNCDHALVVTNSSYTENASFVAKKLNVELWNRLDLADQIIKSNNKAN